jgi:hypothetical protein
MAEIRKLMRATRKLIKENDALIKEHAGDMRAFYDSRRERYRLLRALWDIKWDGFCRS